MSKFLESEKPHQSAFKQSSPKFTPEARQPGLYKTKYRPFCLPLQHAVFPKEFNQSPLSPKDYQNKIKPYHEWTLSNFIEVAYNSGILNYDVKIFNNNHLRNFRNYIHPYQQVASKFNPDIHTAKISWQVLKTAFHQITKKYTRFIKQHLLCYFRVNFLKICPISINPL
jgi:hypothetical protein